MADTYLNLSGLTRVWAKIKSYIDAKLATETDYGLIKLNPSESINVNQNGQLTVGGRLGQDENTSGIFSPITIEPSLVAEDAFLISEAHGLAFEGRKSLGVITGFGANLSSNTAAGSTSYAVKNTYVNRILCKAFTDGYAAFDEAAARNSPVVRVTSVTINGEPLTPDSSPDDANNPIIITTETSANPEASTKKIRFYGYVKAFSSILVGQGISIAPKTDTAPGCSFVCGAGCRCEANFSSVTGYANYCKESRCAVSGSNNISMQQNSLISGLGHDTTNGSACVAAVGKYSDVNPNTLFAVGNGADAQNRSNAFEVLDEGIVLSSPNGKRYLISVDDSGNLTTTEIVVAEP